MKNNVIVTGGASGIGLATVMQLLIEDNHVIVIDITTSKKLQHLPVEFIQCDLNDAEAIHKAFQQISQSYNELSALINCAGILSYGNVEELDIEDWDKVMNINVKAPFLCSKYSIPLMKNDGVIINVASVQSFFAQPKVAAYASSKSALLGLTRSIAIDYSGRVRCIAVCPGTIETPMLDNALTQAVDSDAMLSELKNTHLTKRLGKPEEIAELINFLISDKCKFITGTEIRVDGGLGVNLGGSID